ncbi:MAG: aldo/keto reductase [Lachnospiraceae bacterium]|nr:aldo/keto reductase [Lachnospiraceae bacterium]
MLYRTNPKNQKQLSILGYGCLRYSKKGTGIDQAKAEEEMRIAIEHGVNYFDTAYTYGGSEVCLGKFLAKGYRDKVNIATKLPHYFVKERGDMERYFTEQLERLQTDHIEYYLMHMLNDTDAWERLKNLGIKEWIAEKKKQGQIENIGFSFHGSTENFLKILEVYDWDFCQIQYNYLDEHSQAGRRGLKRAHEKGMPVIIMEPLRGGRLVQGLPKTAVKLLEKEEPKRSPAEWGLRWLWDQPEVTVVLSGMNDAAQVEENVRIAHEAEAGCMSDHDRQVIEQLKTEINRYMKVPCTGCSYCMPCPAGVDIPGCFAAYNIRYTDSWYQGMKTYVMCTTLKTNPTNASKCLKCGKCEQHCPQNISIRKELEQVKKHMENPVYHIAKLVSKRIGRC